VMLVRRISLDLERDELDSPDHFGLSSFSPPYRYRLSVHISPFPPAQALLRRNGPRKIVHMEMNDNGVGWLVVN
jgi:hypothetical protein